MRNRGGARKGGVKGGSILRDVATGVAWAGGAVALASAAAGLARADLAMIFLVGVLGAGALGGLLAGLTAATAGALAYDLLFLEPRFTLDISRAGDALTFAVFFLAAVLTGWLSARARESARRALARAAEVERLLAFSRRLAGAGEADEVAQVLVEEAAAATAGAAVLLTREGEDFRVAAAHPPGTAVDDEVLIHARAVADGREPVRIGPWWMLSVRGPGAAVLVTTATPTPAPANAPAAPVAAYAEQAGVALDRAALARDAADGEALRRTDRLRAALLNSVSHDLRTPLTGILGAATTLLDYGDALPPADRRDLLEGVREAADRLARYVGGLLELAQLEAGSLRPRRDRIGLRELVDEARRRSLPAAGGRAVEVTAAPYGPDVTGDPALLAQALVNVLDNALRHGRAETPVRILIDRDGDCARVLVEDEGPGVAPAVRERLFKPFSGEGRAGGGAGLGLSIAKGFVEAMGGGLRLESPIAQGRGARFVFRLRLAPETSA